MGDINAARNLEQKSIRDTSFEPLIGYCVFHTGQQYVVIIGNI